MRIRVILATAFVVALTAQPAAAQSLTYTWTGLEGFQSDRVFRDGTASAWNSPKAFPGYGDHQNHQYIAFDFLNSSVAPSPFYVDYTFNSNSSSVNTFFVAYLNGFNPLDIAQSYLGDIGQSAVPGAFSVLVPGLSDVILVASSVNPLAYPDETWSINYRGAEYEGIEVPGTVPEPATLLLLGTGLFGVGLVGLLRRTA